jgi:hypothetical protein
VSGQRIDLAALREGDLLVWVRGSQVSLAWRELREHEAA